MPRLDRLAPILIALAACRAPPAPTRSAASSRAPASPAPAPADPLARCPVGDATNVAVYDFIVRELAAPSAVVDRAAVRGQVRDDRAARDDPELKPARASVIESAFSHILTTLCAGTAGCVGVGVYDRNGLALGLSALGDVIPTLGFGDDARWRDLSRADRRDGAAVALTCDEATDAGLACAGGHRLVVFPVYAGDTLQGVATCIVAP